MDKIIDIKGALIDRRIEPAATDAVPSIDLQPYELGFIDALLYRDGVIWGDAIRPMRSRVGRVVGRSNSGVADTESDEFGCVLRLLTVP